MARGFTLVKYQTRFPNPPPRNGSTTKKLFQSPSAEYVTATRALWEGKKVVFSTATLGISQQRAATILEAESPCKESAIVFGVATAPLMFSTCQSNFKCEHPALITKSIMGITRHDVAQFVLWLRSSFIRRRPREAMLPASASWLMPLVRIIRLALDTIERKVFRVGHMSKPNIRILGLFSSHRSTPYERQWYILGLIWFHAIITPSFFCRSLTSLELCMTHPYHSFATPTNQ